MPEPTQEGLVNYDAATMKAFFKAAKATLRIPCGSPKGAYQLRYKFYNFLRRAKAGRAEVPTEMVRKLLDASTNVILVLEGDVLVLRNKKDDVGMANLIALLGDEAQEEMVVMRDKETADFAALGDRLLKELGEEAAPDVPSGAAVPLIKVEVPASAGNRYSNLLKRSE